MIQCKKQNVCSLFPTSKMITDMILLNLKRNAIKSIKKKTKNHQAHKRKIRDKKGKALSDLN